MVGYQTHMKPLRILTIPDPILRQSLSPVTEINQELILLAESMIETMYRADGVGLAANQVGVDARIFVYGFDGFELNGVRQPTVKPQAVINPEIEVLDSRTEIMNEGCLSIPGLTGPVARPVAIRLQGLDLQGNEFSRDITNYEARVVQHETDHLNGKLYLDYITDPTKLQRDEE